MSNIAYEALGRLTWSVGKRKLRRYLVPARGNRAKRGLIVVGVLAVAVVAAGAALERHSAQ